MTLPLHVLDVTKAFGRHQVLSGIDLDIEVGETVVLTGPNGSGKSTLLGCICGTVVPDQGTIQIGGHDLRLAPILARAALRYLPQEIEVPEGVTGSEYLAFFRDIYRGDEPPQDLAMRTGLGTALHELATTYSVGMRRRLAFAANLAGVMVRERSKGRPLLVVLDEPFAGIDADGRAEMVRAMQGVLANGGGLLVAAHDRDLLDLEVMKPRRFDLAVARRALPSP